jgi:CelD/BcsL family acetyltransferase involved in cellulose biosynthesis
MKAVIYNTIDKSVIEEWQTFWEKSPFATYTNSPQWFLSVLKAFTYNDYIIIAMYENDELRGVAAFVKEKKYGVNTYTVAPSNFICGLPFLLDPDDRKTVKTLGKELMKLGTVCLENIPETFVETLKNVCEVNATQSTINYYVDISKNEKGEVVVPHRRRLLRRSESIEGELSLHWYTESDQKALLSAISIDKNSNKQAFGYNAFSSEEVKAFYKILQEKFGNYFEVYLLEHKGKPIAYQIGFNIGNTFFCSQIAFLKEYEIYSIGRSMLIRLIEHLGKNNVQVVDFGSGEDHVKRSLTKNKRTLYSLVIGKNKYTREYIRYICATRSYLYTMLHKNKKMYSLYRKIKNV